MYYVAQCPRCGNIQSNERRDVLVKSAKFKCRKCNKATGVYTKEGYPQLKHFEIWSSPQIAEERVKRKRLEQGEK